MKKMNEEKAVDVVYSDFKKALDTVFHSLLLKKISSHGLNFFKKPSGWLSWKIYFEWNKTQLTARAQ